MEKPLSEEIVDSILVGNKESFMAAFQAAIAAKVTDALEVKKVEIASTLITPEVAVEEEIELVNLEKEHPSEVLKFASDAHEQWRKGFDPENTGKERIKKNSDGTEGNINVPFSKLHPDWQKENLAAGYAAKKAIELHPNDIEKASEHVHNEWMKRNPKADYNAAQHVPYADLPENEKQKDRDHVLKMNSLVSSNDNIQEASNVQKMGRTKIVRARVRGGKVQRRKKFLQ